MLIDSASLSQTVDAVNAAHFAGRTLAAAERRQAARWIAARQGLPGCYAGTFAGFPTERSRGIVLSGALIRWLLDKDLVDELNLFIFPVVIGQGTRLFPDAGPDRALELVDSRATPRGVTIQVYRPTGRVQVGTATADFKHVPK